MDEVIVLITTFVAVLTSLYLFALSRVQFLKKNWVEYRCNPLYMPMAGLVGDSVVTNFTKCTMKGFQDYAGFVMDPLMGEFAVVNETLDEVGGAMNSMRSMMSGVRGGFLGIIGSVFGKIQNLMSQFQYIIIRMRTLLSRIVGVMLSFIYVFYTGMDTGESVMNGPIGETVSFLCFDPNTQITLFNGIEVSIDKISIGDKLKSGAIVTAIYNLSGKNVDMFYLNGVTISGNHKVKFEDMFIPVKDHPDSIILDGQLPYLSCIDTDTHHININEMEFLDFSEQDAVISTHHKTTNIVVQSVKTLPIKEIKIGTILDYNNKVVGTVETISGHGLITTTGYFKLINESGVDNEVLDAIMRIRKLSQ